MHFEILLATIVFILWIIIDCCAEESVGEENVKGILKYDITHASSLPVTKQCPNNEFQRVDRFCLKNSPYKAEWNEVDFSLCISKTTKKLLSLNQVGEILQVFSHHCNFLTNKPKTDYNSGIGNYIRLITTILIQGS